MNGYGGVATRILIHGAWVCGWVIVGSEGEGDDTALEHPERQMHGAECEACCARTGRYLPRIRLSEKE